MGPGAPFALIWSWLLLALASQYLWPWPIPHHFELEVFSCEWGYLLALLALGTGLKFRHWLIRLPSFLVVVVGLAPCFQAQQMGRGFHWLDLGLGWNAAAPQRSLLLSSGLALDLYLPQRGPAPGVLVVHGGSWARGSRRDFPALNQELCRLGFVVASLDYRLAPAHPYPAALEDLETAHRELLERAGEFRLDPQRIAWLGRSAGAHLALLQAYAKSTGEGGPRARCVVALYPPTDMLWSYEHPSPPEVLDSCRALEDFLQGPPQQLPERYRQASPLTYADSPQAIPTLLIHGLRDTLVSPQQSLRLQRRLEANKVPCQTLYLPWAQHGCDVNLSGPSGQLCRSAIADFLQQFL